MLINTPLEAFRSGVVNQNKKIKLNSNKVALPRKAHSEINFVQDIDDCDLFLSKIYFQKIPYKIVDNHVEEIGEQYFNPKNLLESLTSLETGQVYSVLIKEDNNNFMCLGRNK